MISSAKYLQSRVYQNVVQHHKDIVWLHEHENIAPYNESVKTIIWELIKSFPVEATSYKSVHKAMSDDEAVTYPTEFLNSLEPSGMLPHHFLLKIGLKLLRKLDPPRLCNRTQVIINQLLPNCINVTITTGPNKGEQAMISRIPIIPSDTGMPFEFRRIQFAFA